MDPQAPPALGPEPVLQGREADQEHQVGTEGNLASQEWVCWAVRPVAPQGSPLGGEGGRAQFPGPLTWSCGRAVNSVSLFPSL